MIRIALVAILAVVLVAGCINQFCTAKGCWSQTDVCAGPDTAHWRVCRNELCTEQMGDQTVEEGLVLGGVFATPGCISVTPTGRLLKDGDIYTLTRWADDGTEVASYRWTAEYEKIFPNGEDCDGDYFCMQATLDETNAE